MSEWYKITGQRIEFQKSGARYWAPESIREPCLPRSFDSREWVITGQGPMWMYAHTAAQIAASQGQFRVELASPPGTSEDLTKSRCRLHRIPDSPRAIFEIELEYGIYLTEGAIRRLIQPALDQLGETQIDELCITGRANGIVYANVAAQAVQKQIQKISCWTPADGLVIVYQRNPRNDPPDEVRPEPEAWLLPYLKMPENPVVVGILGDPNCGKSVLSLALNHYRGVIGCRGWRLDCDGASPTPDWYLSQITKDPLKAKSTRDAMKLEWTEEMESEIARKIHRLRDFFDVAIADLPGGNHKIQPPQRVPKHREVMMKEIDVFVLIERSDQPTESDWRAALEPHQLADRIAIVLHSEDPKSSPTLDLEIDSDGTYRGTIRGLDREKRPEELVNGYRNGFEKLWFVLLQHGRQREKK